jgi:chemotaxis protein MotB
MAKEKQDDLANQPNPMGWMVTFSDLLTLLLTFFVLLIAMSSMDAKAIQKSFSMFFTDASGVLQYGDTARMQKIAQLLEQVEAVPAAVLLDQEEVKQTIFDFEDVDVQKLMDMVSKDITVTKEERGLVIKLADYIVFHEGTAQVRREYLPILNRVADVLRSSYNPISVEGHTDDTILEGQDDSWAWQLSLERALAVLEYFTQVEGLLPERFRAGGFGPSKPLVPNDSPENRAKNRRIEIVLYKEQYS